MLTKEEAERLAQAINALRPDWHIPSLITFLGTNDRWKRPYRDLTLELVYVALDPASKTPARIDQDGPWTRLHQQTQASASADIDPLKPSDCDICGRPPNWRHIDHVYQPRDISGHGIPIPEPKRQELAELMAATELELTAAKPEESE